jgi:hypothetical protein
VVQPNDVDDLLDKQRVGGQLEPSLRWGCRPKSFQIRPIVEGDSPDLVAIDVRDQWVAFFGVDSSVVTSTSPTWSRVIDAGRPGRSSSTSPSRRLAMNRDRHLPTVTGLHRSVAATVLLSEPSAQASTIFERSANAWDDFGRRDHDTSWERSGSVNVSTALGRPDLILQVGYPFHCQGPRLGLCHREA